MAVRILVIDDDMISRAVLVKILASAEYEVLEAEDGMAGMELLHTTACSLVITDLMMPRMDGTEVILRVRQAYPGVPCIVISGNAAETSQGVLPTAILLGAAHAIAKPFSREAVLDAVAETLCAAGV